MSRNHTKHVSLDYDFFVDLMLYVLLHSDLDDERYQRIIRCAEQKFEAMARHDLYTTYKSGSSEEERKEARRAYLEKTGLQKAFMWSDEQDINVLHSFPDMGTGKDSS